MLVPTMPPPMMTISAVRGTSDMCCLALSQPHALARGQPENRASPSALPTVHHAPDKLRDGSFPQPDQPAISHDWLARHPHVSNGGRLHRVHHVAQQVMGGPQR